MSKDENELLEKLRKIERLHAGATTPGERDAAADAMARIQKRLGEVTRVEKVVEYKFRLTDEWSRKLFVALLRRYGIQPYRRRGQRRFTVLARVPRSFAEETLWPEFVELAEELKKHLEAVTDRVIAQGIHSAPTEVDEED